MQRNKKTAPHNENPNEAIQQINETTFIYKSLVTWEEYQPFIDEMREGGGYHQPDHWNSFHFPAGKAREPVRGVRYSDALAFCEWLTQKEENGWAFRLPHKGEGDDYPLKDPGQNPVGYWVTGSDRQAGFSWIGISPENARGIDFAHMLNRDTSRLFSKSTARENALSRAFDLIRIFDLERQLSRALDLDHDLLRARELARERARALHLDLADDLAFEVDSNLDRDFERAIGLAHALDRSTDNISDNDRALRDALHHALDRDRALDNTLAFDFVIYLDLLTIQERVAGRSPAFEGIRLVKERVGEWGH